jgi:hypothetical protein
LWHSKCLEDPLRYECIRNEDMTNCFELHLGFPDDPASVAAAERLLAVLKAQKPDWTCSDVLMVSAKGCIDPHNVPGTLKVLISREIPLSELTEAGPSLERNVLRSAQETLNLMTTSAFTDARLEIEYPYGCFYLLAHPDRVVRNAILGDPLGIEDGLLHFKDAAPVKSPRWEIHFVVEKSVKGPNVLTIEDVAAKIGSHEVKVEQTISYRSQTMKDRGVEGSKFISTAYYDTSEEVEQAARRLFYDTDLCESFAERGYSVKLILEHIIGCFQPLIKDHKVADMETLNAY